MPLSAEQVNEEQRKEAGRQAARAHLSKAGNVEAKPVGNTSATEYPYTYWYVVGWNEVVEERPRPLG
ncbi:hypothetical protein SEA_Phreeze_33 [Mycobacterium phage Phreeze]|nr:hypothetical protein SEA_Phreeze_33 [Mycobacterium phage Phreeze]